MRDISFTFDNRFSALAFAMDVKDEGFLFERFETDTETDIWVLYPGPVDAAKDKIIEDLAKFHGGTLTGSGCEIA